MVKLLKERGTGKILAGDQSGFGAVQWTKDREKGSSRQLAKTAGLLKVIEDSDAEPCFFEEYGWDAYRPAYPDGEHHWKRLIMVPAKLDEVEHCNWLSFTNAMVHEPLRACNIIHPASLRHGGSICYYAKN